MFITLEGPEGSGKTTAVSYAVEELSRRGYQIVRTREPGVHIDWAELKFSGSSSAMRI